MKARTGADTTSEFHGPDAQVVRQMFGEIAHRYDFLNHFLSVSIDKRWRRITAKTISEHILVDSNSICLDLCSGTGDLAIELHRRLLLPVVASDLCHPMLVLSLDKTAALPIRTVEADSMATPLASD